MCTSKAEGGKRCSPTPTARATRSLRGKLDRAQGKGDAQSVQQIQARLDSLEAAREKYGPIVAPHSIDIPDSVTEVMSAIRSDGNNPLLVGGTVRDAMIGGVAPKDFDIEVYGVEINDLARQLRRKGYQVDEVGVSFGVLKVRSRGEELDISVPRTDSATGEGHRGFDVQTSTDLDVESASSRRDFTINAIMYDDQHQVIIDPHGGAEDLRNGTLRHISDAYGDDVLRPLRGFQFAGRFGMDMHPDTVEASRQLYPQVKHLASERIAMEWEKFYRKSTAPGKSLKVLSDMGWDGHAPGLEGRNTEELRSRAEKMSQIADRDGVSAEERTYLMAATVARTMPEQDRYRFLKTTLNANRPRSTTNTLVRAKLTPDTPESRYRELADEMKGNQTSIRSWCRLEEGNGNPDAPRVLANAERYGVADEPEAPFIMGRDVMAASTKRPGPWVAEVLKKLQAEQYSRAVSTKDQAQSRLRQLLDELQ